MRPKKLLLLKAFKQLTGSFKLNGYEITEISNDTSLTDGSATSLPTENAVKSFIDAEVGDVQTYLRKQFVKLKISLYLPAQISLLRRCTR